MSKSKVFLFVENATSSFLRFHSGTERFFEKKKKDANYRNAIILFILSVTVLTFLFYLTSFDLTTVNIFLVMAESQGYLVHGLLRAVFSNLSLFLTSAVIYFLVLTKGFKIKINFVQILYFYGLIVSVSAIANVLFLLSSVMQEYVSSSIPGMGVLVISILAMVVALVVALYLMLTAFKVLSSLSYKKTILALIVVAIIAGMLLPFVLLFTTVIQWTILGSGNPPTYYYYNVTANTDGSITATYAWMLNSTNKPKEICYVGFPKGWVLAEYDITSMVVLAERNRTVESYDMSDVFYKSNTGERDIEYFIFVHSPPQDWGRGFSNAAKNALKSKEDGEIFKNIFKIKKVVYDFKSDGLEFLDIMMSDDAEKFSRHELDLSTLSGLGYAAVYQAFYDKDNDIDYILDHTKCYKYGW